MKNRIHELYALEQLSSGGSCVHRLHPLVKIATPAVFIVTVVSFDRYALGPLMPYIFYPLLIAALSETPHSMLFKRFLIAAPFCLFAGISNLLFDRTAAFTIGRITVSFGLVSLGAILFKTYLCVMAVLLLVSITPFFELANEMRRLRIPDIFITMFEMTYRYIGVLLYEAYTMSVAYSLRSANKKGIAMRDMGSFTGQLLIRSFDRADRVYRAMKCRGYNSGAAPHGIARNAKRLSPKDALFFIAVSLLCVTFRVFDIDRLFAVILGSFLKW
jgi:cobalt/nickel transport system permease protein